MARPLRMEVAGGWYHVTARGNERKAIFRDDADRRRFVELLAEWVARFGVRLHAWVLMDNHYHLLVETPRGNLTQAMQWLQVSYAMRFNRRHRRSGHLFQGRYKAILVEAETAVWELSRYVHLNPVRIGALGLDKAAQRRRRVGEGEAAGREMVRARLERLREYPWSSYRGYVGLAERPKWLRIETVLGAEAGRRLAARRRVYEQYVEEAVREGVVDSPWERLAGQVLLGGAEFVRRMRRRARGDVREQPSLKQLRERPGLEQIIGAVERIKGEKWEAFRDRHGDWGRDMVLYLGRRRGGLRLRELAHAAGGIDYGSAQVAVHRLERRIKEDGELDRLVKRLDGELFDDET